MKPILEVRNLWKQYKIGGQQASYLSLRERLLQPFQRQQTDTFWALQDINFDVYEGECIGIIGKNGAGKSTLLKILSQITPPTKGYIKARGRVASLLEVGTGFHPELTGRENVYLNGSILGLKRSEINAKFDEIIDFSGVEKFLDTPLKHYSSGMRLRLAFSVAAHLEPEILLIDEVLAVGDAEFQKKCLGKMDEVSKSGRTVIFVSHNLGAVRQLCNRGILLKSGDIIINDNITAAINLYNTSFLTNIAEQTKVIQGKKLFQDLVIENFDISVTSNIVLLSLSMTSEYFNKISSVVYPIYTLEGQRISLVDLRTVFFEQKKQHPKSNKITISTTLPLQNYVEGRYQISLALEYNHSKWYESKPITFEITPNNEVNNIKYESKYRGFFDLTHQTTIYTK